MANISYNATGVLILDRVTPVIEALFGGMYLHAAYPGDGEAFIAQLDASPCVWDDIRDKLFDLIGQLNLPLERQELSLQECLSQLAKHFGVEGDGKLRSLVECDDFDTAPDVQSLFLMATCFDDGHGLSAIKFEGSWHCSKPRLSAFGGGGSFISREITLHRSSTYAVTVGDSLRTALVSGLLDRVVDHAMCDVLSLLRGISDDATRQRVGLGLANRLHELYAEGS